MAFARPGASHPIISPYISAKQRVFQSIFRPSLSESTPTPLATPVSATQPSIPASFNSSVSTQPDYGDEDEFARSTRAWHIATAFLTFSQHSFPRTKLNELAVTAFLARKSAEAESGGVLEAIRWINRPESQKKNELERESHNLLDWYLWQTRRHFLSWSEQYVVGEQTAPLEEILNRLLTVHAIYTEMLQQYVLAGIPTNEVETKAAQYTQELNSLISYQLEKSDWAKSVYSVFLRLCGTILGVGGIDRREEDDFENSMRVEEEEDDDEPSVEKAFPSIDETVEEATLEAIHSQATVATEPDHDGDIHLSRPSTAPGSIGSYADDKPYMRALHPGPRQRKAKKKLLRIWATLQLLGLGGSGRRGERVFAEAIHNLITKYVDESYSGMWLHPSYAQEDIAIWVTEAVAKLVRDVLNTNIRRNVVEGRTVPARRILSARASFRASTGRLSFGNMMADGEEEEDDVVKPEDVQTWKKIANGRLGRLRVSELFDIVVEWPESKGGIQDLADYISTPSTRLHLISTFNQTINTRLLHPGASTTDILKVYISLIEAFAMLDPKGVLLDRVSRGVRRYLKDRDDTIRIIVRGVFGPANENESREEYSIDLTQSLASQTTQNAQIYDDFDYDDMSWVPDPVDAGSDFKRSKGSDVVGSLLDLYENKDSVVKEIQTYLASRLLEKEDDSEMDHEIRTLELLKNRLSGDAALQSCDVMIKDLADSRRTDDQIQQELWYDTMPPLDLRTKILSKLYWPRLKEDTFQVPPPVAELQAAYVKQFEKINSKRTLVWLPAEGYVDVELEMENRIVKLDGVKPAFATVIYAFSSDDDSEKVTKTLEDLEDSLEMETPLLKKALNYWINKGILTEVGKDTYAVLDSSADSGEGAAEADTGAGVAAPEEEEEAPKLTPQERIMYTQFVFGMLMNSKRAMQTAEIMRTLEMLVPGGCNCTEAEMEGLLEEMEERGIRREGETWRYKK